MWSNIITIGKTIGVFLGIGLVIAVACFCGVAILILIGIAGSILCAYGVFKLIKLIDQPGKSTQ